VNTSIESHIVWQEVSALVAAVGLLLTGVGLCLTGIALRRTARVARNTFMLSFYDHIQTYNPIHIKLQSEWSDGTKGPDSPGEWNSVRRYMGLFEGLWRMIQDGVYPLARADCDYSHRLLALVCNSVIREQCLDRDTFAWRDFFLLWHKLESCETYRGLVASSEKRGCPSLQHRRSACTMQHNRKRQGPNNRFEATHPLRGRAPQPRR